MSQEVIDKMEVIAKSVDAYKINTEKTEASIEEITKSLSEVKKDAAKTESLTKSIESLEKRIGRIGDNSINESQENMIEQKNSINKYLRYRTPIKDSINTEIVKSLWGKNNGFQKDYIDMEVKSLVTGSNPDGGYLIRPEYSAKPITRVWETSPMRAFATVITSSTGIVEFLVDDQEGITGGWVGEMDDRVETGTPKFGTVTISTHEQYAEPRISQRMLDDSAIDIQGMLQNKVLQKFTRVENTSFFKGDGVKKARGFLTLPAWGNNGTYQNGALEHIKSGSAGGFTSDSLKTLQDSLLQEYQPNAVWFMTRSTFTFVKKLKNLQGNYMLDENSLKVGDTPILLGKPVIFASDMEEVATDSLSIAYGDFKDGYTIIDGVGTRIIRDIYTKKGFVKYFVTKFVGGDVTNYQSIKILKLSA